MYSLSIFRFKVLVDNFVSYNTIRGFTMKTIKEMIAVRKVMKESIKADKIAIRKIKREMWVKAQAVKEIGKAIDVAKGIEIAAR